MENIFLFDTEHTFLSRKNPYIAELLHLLNCIFNLIKFQTNRIQQCGICPIQKFVGKNREETHENVNATSPLFRAGKTVAGTNRNNNFHIFLVYSHGN